MRNQMGKPKPMGKDDEKREAKQGKAESAKAERKEGHPPMHGCKMKGGKC